MSNENEKPSENTSVLMVKSPEDRLGEAAELERLILEDEDELTKLTARRTATKHRIAEMTLKMRQLLRTDTFPLPLFDQGTIEGSGSSTDHNDQADGA